MSVGTYRVLMGACGWKHSAWLNEFYSDDLPEDWQLGFYSNEFPVVYVPTVDWINEKDLSEWVDDISDSFRSVLEISTSVLKNEAHFLKCVENIKSLGESCLGIVFKVNSEMTPQIDLLQQRVNIAHLLTPICIDINNEDMDSDFINFLSENSLSTVWHGDGEGQKYLNQGDLAVSLVSSDNLDMAGLRHVIETSLKASSEERTSVLCFEGKPPSLEILRNADIILNLL